MPTYLIATLLQLAAVISPASSADPRTWIVAPDASGDYHSIQEAIDAAGNGDTVEIKAGEYFEDVTIHSKQHLRLIGEGVDRVTVMGRSRVGAFHIGKWPYGASDITVSGLTVNSHGGLAFGIFNGRQLVLRNLKINGLLFSQQAHDVRVEDCVIGDSETTGIAFAESQGALVHNVIHDNDHGVTIAGTSDVRLERNVIIRSLFDAVVVSDTSRATLTSNTIVKNGRGVVFTGSSEGKAAGNIVGFNRIGFHVEPTAHASLSYNAIYNGEHDDGEPTAENGNVRVDPGFVNPNADDFRLRPDSPARKVGSFPFLGALPPLSER